jgi:hypothetical protein
MELIVAVALLALFGAWWIARVKAGRNVEQVDEQQTTPEYRSTPPTPHTNLQPEGLSHYQTPANAKPERDHPFAEIADPNGGVREISADEVSAYFRPIRTKLASLGKVAANSTRIARAFAQSGGATPDVETYRRAHRDAVALTAETEGLLDTILFGAEADSNSYDELLEQVIDVEMELEESLELIARTEAQIASGDFLSAQPKRMAKSKAQSAEL